MALYLVRHGETEWNRSRRHQGRLDSPLTERGNAQARAAGAALAAESVDWRTAAIFSSPLGRARASAALICAELGLAPEAVVLAPALAEHDWGIWSGLTNDEIELAFPGAQARRAAAKWDYAVPAGESYARLTKRVGRWIDLLDRQRTTLIVAHEMVSRVLRGRWLGLDPPATLALGHAHGTVIRLEQRDAVTLAAAGESARARL